MQLKCLYIHLLVPTSQCQADVSTAPLGAEIGGDSYWWQQWGVSEFPASGVFQCEEYDFCSKPRSRIHLGPFLYVCQNIFTPMLCLRWSFVPYCTQFATYGVFGMLDTKFLCYLQSQLCPAPCQSHARVLNTILHRNTASYWYFYKTMFLLYKDKLNVDVVPFLLS